MSDPNIRWGPRRTSVLMSNAPLSLPHPHFLFNPKSIEILTGSGTVPVHFIKRYGAPSSWKRGWGKITSEIWPVCDRNIERMTHVQTIDLQFRRSTNRLPQIVNGVSTHNQKILELPERRLAYFQYPMYTCKMIWRKKKNLNVLLRFEHASVIYKGSNFTTLNILQSTSVYRAAIWRISLQ